jgi:hypothetical protein
MRKSGGSKFADQIHSQKSRPMRDLKDTFRIKTKGVLFLLLGMLAGGLLLFEAPSVRVAILLIVTVWAFCRAYYFAFYVIEKYLDSGFRCSGLMSALRFLFLRNDDGVKTCHTRGDER